MREQLKGVNNFKYLDSAISNGGSFDKKINARICKPNQHNIRQSTKMKVY